MRLCSISVDLDEITCYSQIHGLTPEGACPAVYDLALGRMRDFAASAALPLTLFVIARDLERSENVVALRQMVSDGHEIGNHTLDHLYDLTRREGAEQCRQIELASARIE
ncbi:MAG TPA: polysaccharide deacetylase family protein, partial [Polyangiaceae bacterium]